MKQTKKFNKQRSRFDYKKRKMKKTLFKLSQEEYNLKNASIGNEHLIHIALCLQIQ